MSVRVVLITLGSPNSMSGGHLYHRRVADLAPRFDASMTFARVGAGNLRALLPATGALRAASRSGDVLVCDSIVAARLAWGLERISVPAVGMIHQEPGGIDGSVTRRVLLRRFDSAAYRRMAHLMVASEPLRRCMIEQGHSIDRITVVAPGCDPWSGEETAASAGDLRAGSRVAFLCVANWTARKGITDLLDAFASTPGGLGRLHLVGDESVEPRYAAQVRARMNKLDDRVIAHGPVSPERVDALYRSADVFVLPSYREPYGTVYGEALRYGLPVIGWRAGNLPHLIEHGREGLMSEPGDLESLAASMTRIATDDELRVGLGLAAKSRGASLPTWKDAAERFFAILRKVASGA